MQPEAPAESQPPSLPIKHRRTSQAPKVLRRISGTARQKHQERNNGSHKAIWTQREVVTGGERSGRRSGPVSPSDGRGEHVLLLGSPSNKGKPRRGEVEGQLALSLLSQRPYGFAFQVCASGPFESDTLQKMHFFTSPSIFMVPISNERRQSD